MTAIREPGQFEGETLYRYELSNHSLSGLIDALQRAMADHGDMLFAAGHGAYYFGADRFARIAGRVEVVHISNDPIDSRPDEHDSVHDEVAPGC